MSEDLEAFKRRLADLGLNFTDEDARELYRGWKGIEPQVERVRAKLAELE